MTIGVLKDGKWVFNKACTTMGCHAVVHFEVKTSRFGAVFHDDRPNRGGTSAMQAVSSTVISNVFRKTRTQLGPSSSLDYRAGFTLPKFYTTF